MEKSPEQEENLQKEPRVTARLVPARHIPGRTKKVPWKTEAAGWRRLEAEFGFVGDSARETLHWRPEGPALGVETTSQDRHLSCPSRNGRDRPALVKS